MGLIDPPGKIVSGEILLGGEDILKYSDTQMEDLRGDKIAMIFQEPMTALNPVITIGDQIDEQIIRHLKLSKKESTERGIGLLSRVGIPSPAQRYSNYPHQLSGGMRQRAMIAMALSCDPELLIADEPTTALDVTIQAQILDLLQTLQEESGMSVQFITHDLGVISELADEILVMYAGKVCETGKTDTIMNNPKHPYTQALLSSIPKFRTRVDRLKTIRGTVPTPLNLPKGCAFSNRCQVATPSCELEVASLKSVKGDDEHMVACHLEN